MRPPLLLALLSCAAPWACAQPGAYPDPSNPDIPVPVLRSESAFVGYRPYREQNVLPWRQVNHEAAAMPDRPPPAPEPEHAAPGSADDTIGVVKSINRDEGKLTLKHGPIAKYDMPGMTMVFRVADPGLLDRIREGDRIGVAIARNNGAFVITAVRKQGE